MKMLENKVVLITGGSKGIGKAMAKKLAQSGANVAFTYLSSEESALQLEMELSSFGIKAKAYKSDASNFEMAQKLIDDVNIEFGKIDVLVNNAGITKDNLILRLSENDWDSVIDTNLKSVFNMTKAITKVMIKQRNGSIINVSSVVGVNGNAGQSNYSASKAGIIGFTKSIAKELGSRNIRCNAIAPGFIETEMTGVLDEKVKEEWVKNIPLRRAGNTDDVADLTIFLASDFSTYITGQVISVCGGMSM